MSKLFLIILLIFFSAACSSNNTNEQSVSDNPPTMNHRTALDGKIEVNIELVNEDLSEGDDLLLNVEIKNADELPVELLFDKPESAMGPWATFGQVVDMKTGESVVNLTNKSVLSSTIYSDDDLKELYYVLQPGETLNKNYSLTEIVVLNDKDQKLRKGSYTIELFYHDHKSNTLKVEVK